MEPVELSPGKTGAKVVRGVELAYPLKCYAAADRGIELADPVVVEGRGGRRRREVALIGGAVGDGLIVALPGLPWEMKTSP